MKHANYHLAALENPTAAGPGRQIAAVSGSGSVSFDSCIFNTWDAAGVGLPALTATGGDLVVRGCDFQTPHVGGQVLLGNGTRRAIITGNLVNGTCEPAIVIFR